MSLIEDLVDLQILKKCILTDEWVLLGSLKSEKTVHLLAAFFMALT
jgi:hypothetical protein